VKLPRTYLIAIFLFAVLGFAAFYWLRDSNSTSGALARIGEIHGSVTIQRAGTTDSVPAQKGDFLNSLDTIQTDSDSSALISFNRGFEIDLKANSRFSIEIQETLQRDKIVFLNFQTGDFSVVQNGPPGAFWVSHGRKLYDPSGRPPGEAMIVKKPAPPETLPPKVIAETEPAPIPTTSANGTLSDQQIVSAMTSQKPLLNRCYAQYLQSHPDGQGQVEMSFVIQPAGILSQLQFLSSNLGDDSVLRCIREVFSRSRFPSFSGAAIVVNYPLVFE
jgi:hypothetical protein